MPAIDSRATFTGGRRPKAAKERTRGDSAERLPRTPLWSGALSSPISVGAFFLAFALSFVRPRRRLSSAPTVDFGRRRAQKLSRSAVAPPSRHISTFPGRALTASSTAADWMVTGWKNARLLSFSTSSLFASGCLSFAGSASMSMSRAMIASAYIRQLRSGLPLCCMHGRSRR